MARRKRKTSRRVRRRPAGHPATGRRPRAGVRGRSGWTARRPPPHRRYPRHHAARRHDHQGHARRGARLPGAVHHRPLRRRPLHAADAAAGRRRSRPISPTRRSMPAVASAQHSTRSAVSAARPAAASGTSSGCSARSANGRCGRAGAAGRCGSSRRRGSWWRRWGCLWGAMVTADAEPTRLRGKATAGGFPAAGIFGVGVRWRSFTTLGRSCPRGTGARRRSELV